MFLSILGSCYTTFDGKLFENAATPLPGYIRAIFSLNTLTTDWLTSLQRMNQSFHYLGRKDHGQGNSRAKYHDGRYQYMK